MMVVGEAAFVAAGPLEVFGQLAAKIKMQDTEYLYILALRDSKPYIVKFLAGESATDLFRARVRTLRRELASIGRANWLLHYLAKLKMTGKSCLPEGNFRADPIRHFCGTS